MRQSKKDKFLDKAKNGTAYDDSCPNCESTDIFFLDQENGDNIIHEMFQCNKCGVDYSISHKAYYVTVYFRKKKTQVNIDLRTGVVTEEKNDESV